MAPQLLRTEHPTSGDLNRAMVSLNDTISSIRTERFLEVERQIQQRDEGSINAFVTDKQERHYQRVLEVIAPFERELAQFVGFQHSGINPLGTVYAGSGLHRRRMRRNGLPHILDWALVSLENEERKGLNAVCFFFP